MPKKSKINLSDRALLKLAEFTISVIASAEAVKEAKDLPEKQRKAVEDMHSTYLYTFEQIQDVVFPLDCTQADVDTAMNNLAATIDKSDVAKEAVEKFKYRGCLGGPCIFGLKNFEHDKHICGMIIS